MGRITNLHDIEDCPTVETACDAALPPDSLADIIREEHPAMPEATLQRLVARLEQEGDHAIDRTVEHQHAQCLRECLKLLAPSRKILIDQYAMHFALESAEVAGISPADVAHILGTPPQAIQWHVRKWRNLFASFGVTGNRSESNRIGHKRRKPKPAAAAN